jgi:hypothetical protein
MVYLKQSCLYRAVIQSQLHEKTDSGIAKLESLFQVESLPFTQNEHYFFSYKSKLVTRYKSIHRLSKGEFSLCAKLQEPVVEDPPVPEPESPLKAINGKQAHSRFGVSMNTPSFDEKVARALSTLADLGFEGLVRADLLRLDPPTEVDSAFDIMAEVRAYWQGTPLLERSTTFTQLIVSVMKSLTNDLLISFPLRLTMNTFGHSTATAILP